jgi:hypothetical protein
MVCCADAPIAICARLIPQAQHVERCHLMLFRAAKWLTAKIRVHVSRGPLTVSNRVRHRAFVRHHVATGEHTRIAGLQIRPDDHRAVLVELQPTDLFQKCAVRILPEREDERIDLQRLEFAGRLRIAFVVQSHHLNTDA